MGKGDWRVLLRDGRELAVRHAVASDAQGVLSHRDIVCAETDFLTFGPGERPRTIEQQAAILAETERSDVEICLLAFMSEGPLDASPTHVEATREQRASIECSHIVRSKIQKSASVPVGMLGVSAKDLPRVRHSGELSMTVRKPYWSLGIGSHLVKCMLQWARATGILCKLNLRVRTDNVRAIHLYRSHGFAVEGTILGDFTVGGVYYNHHWMGMRL